MRSDNPIYYYLGYDYITIDDNHAEIINSSNLGL